MTTRAATMASAIANRMRQIRDRSNPATRARSATRVTSRIYTLATVVYLDSQSFTAKFPDQSLLVVEPGGPAVPRGHAKTDALVRARRLPTHSPTQLSDSSHYDAMRAICVRATSGRVQKPTDRSTTMTHQNVLLPVQTYQSLVYLLCPDCNQLHYFRAVKFQDGSQVRYNHPQAPDPTQFQSECPSCLAIQDNDQEAVNAAFDHTVSDPFHAVEMKQVPEFTESPTPNRVMACPRCKETCLFSTDWKGNITKFWSFGVNRMLDLSIRDFAEWKRFMAGDLDCGFCERLQANEADAIEEANLYTSEHFPNLNDDPPAL